MSGAPTSEEESLAIYEAAIAPHAAALAAAGNTERAQREYNLATVPLFEEHKARISAIPQAESEPTEPGPDSTADPDATTGTGADDDTKPDPGADTTGTDDPPADPEKDPETVEPPKPRRASSK